MKSVFVVAIYTVFLLSAPTADAQVKILTATKDTCAAYVNAISNPSHPDLLALGGWIIGYLTGTAQGTGIDFLRNESTETVSERLFGECVRHSDELLSVVAQQMAREMIAEYQTNRR